MEPRNRSGFTIIEIVVTLAIIGLIAGIAIPTFLTVSKNIKESNYNNKIALVKTKAEKWASDTGRVATNIAHLIEEGYLEADNESGEFINPIDNTSLLCKTIRIRYESNSYFSEFTNEEFCDYQELEEQTTIIDVIQRDSSKNVLTDHEWTKDNITLEVVFKENTDQELYQNYITKIEWKGYNQKEEVVINHDFTEKNTYLVSASQFLKAKYEVTMTIVKDDKTFVYKAYSDIFIDRQKPSVYQDDISVGNFDEWINRGKTVKIVSTDFDGSGIYGYYIGEKDSSCPTNKSQFQEVSNPSFELDLLQGEYSICVIDKVGNVSDKASVTVIKTDTVAPTLGEFLIDTSLKGNQYYRELRLKIKVNDDVSGAGKLLYCFTETDCNPTEVTLLNDEDYGILTYQQARKKAQKVCVKGVDQAGNESNKVCSNGYLFDNTAPVITELTADVKNHYNLTIASDDAESDIYSYTIFLSTNGKDYSLVKEIVSTNHNINCALGALSANKTYFVKLVTKNNAGMTAEKVIEFQTEFTTDDAEKDCNPVNGYCSNGIYVKYGNHIFALYKVTSNSIFGVNVSNNMKTSIINDFCCDQGTCIEENVYNTAWSGIYSSGGDNSLKVYYDLLPNPSSYLNKEDYTFGSVSSLPNGRYIKKKTLKANYGLLDLEEYYQIYQKPYMKNMGTLLSTVYTICLSSDHYECNNDVDNITGVYALNGYLESQSAVTGAHHDISVNAAMTVPFKRNLKFINGTGSLTDPYVLA